MPMIDVYAINGTFADPKALARELAATLMKIEGVPGIPMFRKNTAAFVHELAAGALSNVEGDSNYVRVQVLTNAGALDRDKQLAVVRQFTDIVSASADDESLSNRTWVLLTEAIDGGWGLAGYANTNGELVAAARARQGRVRAFWKLDQRVPDTGAPNARRRTPHLLQTRRVWSNLSQYGGRARLVRRTVRSRAASGWLR